MEKDNLENLFENLKNEFDIEAPKTGHEHRFLTKIKRNQSTIVKLNSSKSGFWKPLIAIAASLVLCLSIISIVQQKQEIKDLASVSPELSKTQDFFTTTINKELETINSKRSAETDIIIKDALKRVNELDKEYESLKIDLTESGDDKRVIFAMITNFQNRIELLQNVLKLIEEVEHLNQNKDENQITI
jgi:hypothetical protein